MILLNLVHVAGFLGGSRAEFEGPSPRSFFYARTLTPTRPEAWGLACPSRYKGQCDTGGVRANGKTPARAAMRPLSATATGAHAQPAAPHGVTEASPGDTHRGAPSLPLRTRWVRGSSPLAPRTPPDDMGGSGAKPRRRTLNRQVNVYCALMQGAEKCLLHTGEGEAPGCPFIWLGFTTGLPGVYGPCRPMEKPADTGPPRRFLGCVHVQLCLAAQGRFLALLALCLGMYLFLIGGRKRGNVGVYQLPFLLDIAGYFGHFHRECGVLTLKLLLFLGH